MIIFKKRYTKWVPLGNFDYGGYDYITFARRHLKSGMLYFKTKRVNGRADINHVNSVLPFSLINTQDAWDKITAL